MKKDMRSLSANPSRGNPTFMLEELNAFASQDTGILGGKPFYCTVHCNLVKVIVPDSSDRKMFYLACPDCKKKVMDYN